MGERNFLSDVDYQKSLDSLFREGGKKDILRRFWDGGDDSAMFSIFHIMDATVLMAPYHDDKTQYAIYSSVSDKDGIKAEEAAKKIRDITGSLYTP